LPKVTAEYLHARRQEILAAACALFAEKGFAGTSMADVVAATGLATGTLYRYFPSKNDLVLAVCQDQGSAEPGPETASETAGQLMDLVAPDADGRAHASLVSQIWADTAIDTALAAVVTQRHEALRNDLAAQIDQDRNGGSRSGPPSRDSAEVALAALIGYAALVAAEAPVDHDGFRRALLKLLE
jgi:AcrR family transcriptional regulator